jgi:prepilin-type N-terminal cleavage/methylation domain-containing protein
MRGVTMIELMVVITILAILLGLAVPYMRDFFIANRLESASNELIAALSVARNEAMRRGVPVGIQRGTPDAGAQPGDGVWEKGWFVFVDAHGPTSNDPPDGVWQSDEVVIRIGSAPSSISVRSTKPASSTTMSGGGKPNSLNFSSIGSSLSGQVNFLICYANADDPTTFDLSQNGRSTSRGVAVSNMGRSRLARNASTGIAQGDSLPDPLTAVVLTLDAPSCTF